MNMPLGAIARKIFSPAYPCDRCGARACQQIALVHGIDVYLCELHLRVYFHVLRDTMTSMRRLPG